jgi:hypothetical protein
MHASRKRTYLRRSKEPARSRTRCERSQSLSWDVAAQAGKIKSKGVIVKDRTRKIKQARQRVAFPSEFISTMNAWAAANTFYPFMSDVEKSEISMSMGVTFEQVCCMDIIK